MTSEGEVEGGGSVHMDCPHCGRKVETHVEDRLPWWGILFYFGVALVIGVLVLCVVPVLNPIFMRSDHRCPRCGERIKTTGGVKCPSVSNDVVTLRLGSCALVLSLRYAVALAGICTVIATFAGGKWAMSHYGLPDLPRGEDTSRTWEDFVGDCGFRANLGNPLHATSQFDKHYDTHTVHWTGRLYLVQEGLWRQNLMYIHMEPPAGPYRRGEPDLMLMFSDRLSPEVAQLEAGDMIRFEATLHILGRRGRATFGVLWRVTRVAAAADLPRLEKSPLAPFAVRPLSHVVRGIRSAVGTGPPGTQTTTVLNW